MKKSYIYFLFLSLLIMINGCSNIKPNIHNKISTKKIWKAEKDFTIGKIGYENKKYTTLDKFIEITKIREFKIIKSLDSELYLAIDKNGILSHRIIEHKNSTISISPYSYIISPYNIRFE